MVEVHSFEQFARSLAGPPDAPTLTLERRYQASPEQLWDALTAPERLARWFGSFDGAPPTAVGDDFTVDLGGGADDIGRGTVTVCSPARELGYSWQWQDEPVSQVRATLHGDGDGTVLRLEHSRVPAAHVLGYGGGWEQCMLALDDEVSAVARYESILSAHEDLAHEAWQALQHP
jgi:uncharacterized protein YndB with AHSA1/START domain